MTSTVAFVPVIRSTSLETIVIPSEKPSSGYRSWLNDVWRRHSSVIHGLGGLRADVSAG
ncbi:hypothetical protein [Hansschlegelia plantiphila]|uniref:hypothetical protein n=1 Tax=Hansschlegelia plantiphila TaxID=374655 RepID=UPI0022F2A34A|nr:hypothetical protein [Hansschlegelia plantiphila]